MEDFLKKIEEDLEKKVESCKKENGFVKPFSKVFEQIRETKKIKKNKKIISDDSIYAEIITEFLKQNPEIIKNKEDS